MRHNFWKVPQVLLHWSQQVTWPPRGEVPQVIAKIPPPDFSACLQYHQIAPVTWENNTAASRRFERVEVIMSLTFEQIKEGFFYVKKKKKGFSNKYPKVLVKKYKMKRFLSFQYIQYIKNLKISFFNRKPSTLDFLISVLGTLIRKTHKRKA